MHISREDSYMAQEHACRTNGSRGMRMRGLSLAFERARGKERNKAENEKRAWVEDARHPTHCLLNGTMVPRFLPASVTFVGRCLWSSTR